MVVSHDQLMHQDSEWFFRQPRDGRVVSPVTRARLLRHVCDHALAVDPVAARGATGATRSARADSLLGGLGSGSPASALSTARPQEQASPLPLTPLLLWNRTQPSRGRTRSLSPREGKRHGAAAATAVGLTRPGAGGPLLPCVVWGSDAWPGLAVCLQF